MNRTPIARHHRVLIGALVLLAVGLALAVGALLDRERAMQRLSKEQAYWSVAQAEIELYRFVAALEAYGRGDPAVDHDAVERRFDIFWSRMEILREGDVAQRILAFAGAPEAVAEARAVMEGEEAATMAVTRDDIAEIGRLHARFDEAGLALHRLAVAVNQAEVAMLAQLREELRREVVAILALVGAMVLGGIVLVLLLVRENRRNRELALFNRQFGAAADASESAIVLARRQGDGLRVVYANDEFRRLGGDGGSIGLDPARLFAERLSPAFAGPIEETLRLAHPFTSEAIALEREDGTRWLRLHLTPVADEAGRIDTLMVEVVDIGIEVAARREIEAARDAAMQANAAKSRFVAVMSHEIRTPMNGVLGALGLVAQRNRDHELDGLIEAARVSGETLLAILNDVLDIARMEAGHLSLKVAPIALHELARSVAGAWSPLAAEKGVAFDCRIGDDVPDHVAGDGQRLRQMLVNLVSNAVKFTDAGAIAVTLTARQGGNRVRFEVSDSGPGIAPEDRGRLFREYDQIDQHGRGGTGLGLAIVHRLAGLMGGEVGVDSEPGRGSVFWFELPLPAVEAPAVIDPRVPMALDGLDVLVAEDNATNRLIVSEVLKDLGCSVRLAENGAEALAQAEARTPDIVLMDIAMPVMDGREAQRRLRSHPDPLGTVPVVALTAYAMSDEVARFLAEGFDAVLPKPVAREVLAETLARLTGRGDATQPRPVVAAQPGPQAIDRVRLDALLDSLGEETAGRLAASFLDDVGAGLVRLEAARAAGDLAALERESHMLDGLCATFGLVALAEAARAVNRACRGGDGAAALQRAIGLDTIGRDGLDAFRLLTQARGFATLAEPGTPERKT